MNAVYLETSALCQALVHKVAGARAALDHALVSQAKLVTSAITFAEFGRTMLRALRDGEIEAEEHDRARRFARDIATTSFVLALDEALLSQAADKIFLVEPVRTLDAIHLVSILAWHEDAGGELAVFSRDRRVRDNAAAYGFELL